MNKKVSLFMVSFALHLCTKQLNDFLIDYMQMAFICQDTRPSPLKNSVNFLLISEAFLECELVDRAVFNDGSAVPVERHRPGTKVPLSVSSWSIQPLSKYVAGDVVLNQLWRVHAHNTIKSTVFKSTSISLPKMRNLAAIIPKAFSTTRRARDKR